MITSENGWLPKSIWALGETEDNQIILLGAHPEWGGGWFDRGDDPAGDAEHIISGGPIA